ncbi:hypothetical protein ILUMI_24687 [Ignelater luminosus]|uniref:TIL domain-containing protein n=1 Tax=Ignelater luminosus TaxID=2038154 RepID=A0A8K0G0R4_IGNLU|nr:hypothetical protein ILUMI_24687 [Ignelater luminosus]
MKAALSSSLFLFIVSCTVNVGITWEPRYSLPGQCRRREFYSTCGSICRLNCYTVQVRKKCESTRCVAGCFCKSGFFRNRMNGACVLEDECKKVKNNGTAIENAKNKLMDDLLKLLLNNVTNKARAQSNLKCFM